MALRIVAGELGGRRFVTPPNARPTTERVREAVFSSLGVRVVDASVLDLYAGSGALALEALSRGAACAVLVDSDRSAGEACRANLKSTGCVSRARVQQVPVARFVTAGPPPEAPFHLVLCDPPYDLPSDEVADVLAALATPGWLAPDARVVVERRAPRRSDARSPGDRDAGDWVVVSERAYGDTLVSVLEYREQRTG